MSKQARCPGCQIRYVWARNHPLRAALCPACGGPLQRTTYMSSLQVRYRAPAHKRGGS
jgi:rRNA maturation endonuclease Nob1